MPSLRLIEISGKLTRMNPLPLSLTSQTEVSIWCCDRRNFRISRALRIEKQFADSVNRKCRPGATMRR